MDNLRYEIKMVYARPLLSAIRTQIDLHPMGFAPAYPPRQVNNVYLDTYDLAAWRDNLAGVGGRRKLRLRWYGEIRIAQAHLELKCKQYLVGWKEIIPHTYTFNLTTASWHDILSELYEQAPPRPRVWLGRAPQPTLLNHYWREYYVSADGAVRITLDYDLKAHDQSGTVYPNLTRPLPVGDLVIVEFKAKADEASFPALVEALAAFPGARTRFSKYAHAMNVALF